MTLNQMIYFCKVAETLHYRQAAKELLIAQPSLSKSIALLEKELDVALFEQNGRNISLTRAGETFYHHIKPILEQINAIREIMRQFSGDQRLPVIGAVSPAITSVVAPIMTAYRFEAHSFPRVIMRVDISEALIKAMRNNECDIAFCTYIPDLPDITFIHIASYPFVVVMREDDPLAACESIYPEQLKDRPMAFSNAEAYNNTMMRIFEHYHVTPQIVSYANDDSAQFGMVRAGAAIFITSDYPQIYSKGLAVRRLEQDVCMREIYLAYTERSLLDPMISNLIGFAKEYASHLQQTQPR